MKPGIYGTFETLALAKQGQEVCRQWFQVEKVAVPKPGQKEQYDIKQTFHDNVITWIEEHQCQVPIPREAMVVGAPKILEEDKPSKRSTKEKELATV
jgi:hypothetical protein